MQPKAKISDGVEYKGDFNNNSGALYHLVDT